MRWAVNMLERWITVAICSNYNPREKQENESVYDPYSAASIFHELLVNPMNGRALNRNMDI